MSADDIAMLERMAGRIDTGACREEAYPDNPYPGLRSFRPDETNLFEGRDTLIVALRDRLVQQNVVMVVGGSGSGKSSLVRAGLMPRLENATLDIPGRSGRWYTAEMRPGHDPAGALGDALVDQVCGLFRDPGDPGGRIVLDRLGIPQAHDGAAFNAAVRNSVRSMVAPAGVVSARGLERFVREILEPADNDDGQADAPANLFVLLDQFEEIFKFSDLATRTNVMDCVASIATNRPPGLYLGITMRSEDTHRLAEHANIARVHNSGGVFLIHLLEEEQLRPAIVKPGQAVLLHYDRAEHGTDLFDEPLLLDLVASYQALATGGTGDGPIKPEHEGHRADATPLLQHALRVLWQAMLDQTSGTLRSGGQLSSLGYAQREALRCVPTPDDPGRMLRECLNHAADKALDNAIAAHGGPDHEAISDLRLLFVLTAQRDDDRRWSAQPTDARKVARIAGDESDLRIGRIGAAITSLLGQGYLVAVRDGVTISHEALIRNWQTGRDWCETAAKFTEALRSANAAMQALEGEGRAKVLRRLDKPVRRPGWRLWDYWVSDRVNKAATRIAPAETAAILLDGGRGAATLASPPSIRAMKVPALPRAYSIGQLNRWGPQSDGSAVERLRWIENAANIVATSESRRSVRRAAFLFLGFSILLIVVGLTAFGVIQRDDKRLMEVRAITTARSLETPQRDAAHAAYELIRAMDVRTSVLWPDGDLERAFKWLPNAVRQIFSGASARDARDAEYVSWLGIDGMARQLMGQSAGLFVKEERIVPAGNPPAMQAAKCHTAEANTGAGDKVTVETGGSTVVLRVEGGGEGAGSLPRQWEIQRRPAAIPDAMPSRVAAPWPFEAGGLVCLSGDGRLVLARSPASGLRVVLPNLYPITWTCVAKKGDECAGWWANVQRPLELIHGNVANRDDLQVVYGRLQSAGPAQIFEIPAAAGAAGGFAVDLAQNPHGDWNQLRLETFQGLSALERPLTSPPQGQSSQLWKLKLAHANLVMTVHREFTGSSGETQEELVPADEELELPQLLPNVLEHWREVGRGQGYVRVDRCKGRIGVELTTSTTPLTLLDIPYVGACIERHAYNQDSGRWVLTDAAGQSWELVIDPLRLRELAEKWRTSDPKEERLSTLCRRTPDCRPRLQ